MFLSRIICTFFLIMLAHVNGRTCYAQLGSYHTLQPTEKVDLDFEDTEGKTHKISDYKGKIVILNFWATWCPPCVAEMPSLNNLAHTFPASELVVIPLCKEIKLLEEAKQLYKNRSLDKLPLFFDKNSEGVKRLNVKGLPTTFIIDREGYLIGKLQGGTEWDHYEVLDLIQAYIDGKTPEISSGFARIKKWFKKIL